MKKLILTTIIALFSLASFSQGIKINKPLTDKTGDTVAAGTIVKFETCFPKDGTTMRFALFFYKSQAAYNAGAAAYIPNEINNFSPVYTLTVQDYNSLTPVEVHNKLIAILEAMPGIGANTCVINQ